MTTHDILVLFLLASRLPIYAYVIYRSWELRKSLVLISSMWLGAVGVVGMIGALTNSFLTNKIFANLVGTTFALCLFMLAYTSKQVKGKK